MQTIFFPYPSAAVFPPLLGRSALSSVHEPSQLCTQEPRAYFLWFVRINHSAQEAWTYAGTHLFE
jgi:hypothetical protein